jgi:tRNA nucleotidyltransferase/poly(A) polymerase
VKNQLAREFALDVVRRLRAANYEAYWAGGCVRDLLRGHEPADYDVATSAIPEQVRTLFGPRRTHAVGISFGVMIVKAPKHGVQSVEVATFRTDASYSDGRRPDSVEFSTPEQDALRRDFTINGMFYDPETEKVIDYVGGQSDLQAKVIRAIGDPKDRFAEDKLRMLRAVRFAARFGFRIESLTRQAIRDCAQEVGIVSGERISSELQQTLQSSHASWAVKEWADLGLLPSILPEVHEAATEREWKGCDFLDVMIAASWQAKLAALIFSSCHDDARVVQSLKARLRLSNSDAEAVRFAVFSQSTLEQAHRLPWSTVQPLVVHEKYPYALELLDGRCKLGLDPHCGDWLRHQVANLDELDPPPLLVGKDLIQHGLSPGPLFRTLLEQARVLQLDARLHDRGHALDWLREQIDCMPAANDSND